MKECTKQELRKIAKTALENEYGFAPAIKDIVLLEAYGDGTYILFEVKGNTYRFESSYRFGEHNGVWCGKGTIERADDVNEGF